MALFAVNTGCRDAEICNLRWEWEVQVPELNTSVFVIPAEFVKNNRKRVVVLNSIVHDVIDVQRGGHPTHVFVYKGKPVLRMLNSGWKRARAAVGIPQVRVHDLKHTFGSRLRNAGVHLEDRQQLLGHKSTNMSTHYSAASLTLLIDAAERVVTETGDLDGEAVVLRLGE